VLQRIVFPDVDSHFLSAAVDAKTVSDFCRRGETGIDRHRTASAEIRCLSFPR